MKCVETDVLESIMECTHAMGAVDSTRGRVVELSLGCVRARGSALWTRVAGMTARPVD